MGSPPRARGALGDGLGVEQQAGLTPAGAGSTPCAAALSTRRWAHPRGRGEHAPPEWEGIPKAGSPPRARGAPAAAVALHDHRGLTPAGAGSTLCGCPGRTRRRAHPRGRGEHHRIMGDGVGVRGSPPRARGARRGRGVRAAAGGLTPAGAGSTAAGPTTWPPSGAHPRGRGEHSSSGLARIRETGSPPRARGAHGHDVAGPVAAGLTPAGAGSTWARSTRSTGTWAHPRGRGEHPTVRPPSTR